MISTYDFKNVNRELSSLEKEFTNFENEFDSTLKPILNAKFNANEYGERELEHKLDSIVKDAKREINKAYSDLVNSVRRYAYASSERIKSKARELASYVDELSNKIEEVNSMNQAFANKEYIKAISLAASISSPEKAKNYAGIITLEAYDRLCSERIKTFNEEDYSYYISYYAKCKTLNAQKHIGSARQYLFVASCLMTKISLDGKSIDEKYEIVKMCLECYQGFDALERNKYQSQYVEVYPLAVELFNSISKEKYNSFSYLRVKDLLNDAAYFNAKDIKIDFFSDTKYTPEKMFEYLKNKGSVGSDCDVRAAFNDTFTLATSDCRASFFDYWFGVYDDRGWDYCVEIINAQEDRYVANKLIFESIQSNYSYIKKLGDLSLNIANNYLSFLEKQDSNISLDSFVYSITDVNKLVNLVLKASVSENEKAKILDACKILDGISYGMITKYLKQCSLYNESIIKDLNVVLDDSSIRLNGKPYRKDLKHDESKQYVDKTNICVKFATAQLLKKNRKLLIALGIAGVAVLAGILVVIFMNLK